jgi:hypothetical protein
MERNYLKERSRTLKSMGLADLKKEELINLLG